MKLTTISMALALVSGAAFAESHGNAVAPADVVYDDAGAVEMPLAAVEGDAANGIKVMTSRGLGNCVACHQVSSLDAAFQGEVGPSLDGVAGYRSAAELRGIVANAKMTFPDSVMPSFYKTSGFIRPGDGFTGKGAKEEDLMPLLSAQEIEDVVAFLLTLKDS